MVEVDIAVGVRSIEAPIKKAPLVAAANILLQVKIR